MMKRKLLAVILFGAAFFAHAQQQETWMSLGFEFGNLLENFHDARNTYVGSPGVNLNFYFFEHQKWLGVFNRNSFVFPVVKTGEGNDFNYGTQMAFMIVPAFRLDTNRNLTLQSGIAVNILGIYVDYTEGSYTYPVSSILLGLGADLGLKIDLTDVVFINIGSAFTFSFLNTFSVSSTPPPVKDWVDNYMALEAKPYIGIGINSFTENSRYGKPK